MNQIFIKYKKKLFKKNNILFNIKIMVVLTYENLVGTIQNLNQTGTFVNSSTVIDTAIPPGTGSGGIGLYQLINQMISDLSSLKATIKIQEKNINKALASQAPGTKITTTDVTIANREANDGTMDDRDYLTGTNSTGTINKPAIIVASTAGNLSEDAVFAILQSHAHAIMKIVNNSADAAGESTIKTAAFSSDDTT